MPPHGRRAPRVNAELLASLQKCSLGHLRNLLGGVLGKADDWLFDQSQKEGAATGATILDAMRALRLCRTPLEKSFAEHFESGFVALRRQFNPDAHGSHDLSLLEEEDLEVQLASELVMDAVIRAHGPALDVLERRIECIMDVASLHHAQNPLSAVGLANAIHIAQSGIELPGNLRVVLYKFYERELLSSLGPMLVELNGLMTRAGILPELGNPASADAQYAPPATPVAPARPAPAAAPDDAAVFNALCGLLHTWRPQQSEFMSAAPAPAAVPATPVQRPMAMGELVSVLSLLQATVPQSVAAAMQSPELSLSEMLKREMIANTKHIGLAPDQIRMSRDDEDAIDLVGMLFDVLFDERDFEMQARGLVSRMVVPYVKAAVIDRQMFQSKAHPARRLLNSVAEAVEGNKGEGPQELELLNKAETVVDRLIAEFNEDVAIFETLEQELRAFLDQHRRRIDLAERRATEAQRGQERLEQARQLAGAELESRAGGRTLPEPLVEFLGRNWTHHLSMIALREGPGSHAWDAAIGVADSLLALLPAPGKPPRHVGSALQSLRDPIESVLASSGVTGTAAQEVIRQLVSGLESLSRQPATAKAPPSLESLAAPAPAAAPALKLVSDKAKFDVNAEDLGLFRAMAVGTWIHLAGDDGKHHPAKMSWISPISSRLMFVNRRGVRVLVASVEELAAMKKEGKLITHLQENVFDQALESVMGRLKNDVA